jgi:hypothetical protein
MCPWANMQLDREPGGAAEGIGYACKVLCMSAFAISISDVCEKHQTTALPPALQQARIG